MVTLTADPRHRTVTIEVPPTGGAPYLQLVLAENDLENLAPCAAQMVDDLAHGRSLVFLGDPDIVINPPPRISAPRPKYPRRYS